METSVFVGIGGLVLAIATYFAGARKTSNEEVAKRARFEGEIAAKLDRLQQSFDKLDEKLTRNTSELYAEIEKEIKEHERRYHGE